MFSAIGATAITDDQNACPTETQEVSVHYTDWWRRSWRTATRARLSSIIINLFSFEITTIIICNTYGYNFVHDAHDFLKIAVSSLLCKISHQNVMFSSDKIPLEIRFLFSISFRPYKHKGSAVDHFYF